LLSISKALGSIPNAATATTTKNYNWYAQENRKSSSIMENFSEDCNFLKKKSKWDFSI
jgi:hypothetical protein